MWPAKLKILTVYPLAEKYMMTLALDSQACGFSGPFSRCSPTHTHWLPWLPFFIHSSHAFAFKPLHLAVSFA